MATPKRGDLRLLKDGVVFGPLDRQGLERLLSSGRVSAEDHVSVRDADWVRIADYLSADAAATATEARPPEPPSERAPKKRGDLRVIRDGRIIGSLARADVESLRKSARLCDDDLVCALGGPWIRLGDFLAPSPVPISPARLPQNPPSISPTVAAPAPSPSAVQAGATVHPVPVEQASRPALKDEWFVRVRGIHSAPLRKHHVRSLYQAREVTLENMARHPSWPDNDWRLIGDIEELRDVARR